jgi:hypothetical protein
MRNKINSLTRNFSNKKRKVGRPKLTKEERRQREIIKIDNKIIKITERIKNNKIKKSGRGRPFMGGKDLIKIVEKRNKLASKPFKNISTVITLIEQTALKDLINEYNKLEGLLASKRIEIESKMVLTNGVSL